MLVTLFLLMAIWPILGCCEGCCEDEDEDNGDNRDNYYDEGGYEGGYEPQPAQTVVKKECPDECCVGDSQYYAKKCSFGKTCQNHKCVATT